MNKRLPTRLWRVTKGFNEGRLDDEKDSSHESSNHFLTIVKVLTILSLLGIMLSSYSCNETEVEIITPPPPSPVTLPETLMVADLQFVDTSTGWLAMSNIGKVRKYSGGIFKTTDGGITWYASYQSDSSMMFTVRFIDKEYGWATGSNGIMVSTTNAGKTWERQNVNNLFGDTSALYGVAKTFFLNRTHGWFVGSRYSVGPTCAGFGYVFHTTDGGKTWYLDYSTTSSSLTSIAMLPNGKGWVTGAGGFFDCPPYILYTSTNGSSWARQQLNPSFRGNSYRAVFHNDSLGFVIGEVGILRTTNSGTNWDTTGSAFGSGYGIAILNDTIVYALAGYSSIHSYSIYRSTDKGKHWSKELKLTGYYNRMSLLNDTTGWIAGQVQYPVGLSMYRKRGNRWINIR